MSLSSNINALLREVPRGITFSERLKWLEGREMTSRGEVKVHSDCVARNAVLLAMAVGFEADYVAQLNNAARWHDIGKLATPDAVLNKPGRLDDAERVIMDMHPSDGHLLLGNDAPQIWLDVVKYHHERYDGFGYYGLKGENIPMAARLTAIADVFDALTAKRVYKSGMSIENALCLMSSNVDSPGFGRRAFDPIFLRVFVADYLNKVGENFTDDGRKMLEAFAVSDPMNDLDVDKYKNDGWLLKVNGKRLKYAQADNGNDRLLEIHGPTGELLFDVEQPELSNCRKLA